jgi:hypothetical protein
MFFFTHLEERDLAALAHTPRHDNDDGAMGSAASSAAAAATAPWQELQRLGMV